ncbi:hypothetical protein SAMN05428981_1103 [Bacillus sp. OV194]|nr:hypothetical protein SAMN05428981_1103 [Bacillus sp. OV194]
MIKKTAAMVAVFLFASSTNAPVSLSAFIHNVRCLYKEEAC